MSKYVIAVVCALLLGIIGCEEKKFDRRLVDIAIEHEKQGEEVKKLAGRVEGITGRLEQIEQSLGKISPPSGSTAAPTSAETKTSGPQVVEFKETPEYKQIVAMLSSIQQQVNQAQSSVAATRDDAARERERARLRDPGEMMRAMNDPNQLSGRLDTLLQNFSPKIQDSALRRQFETDVLQFKRGLSAGQSTEELHQRVVAELTERLNNEQNERSREFMNRELQSLQSASGEELAGRLERYTRFQTFRQLRELSEKYNIPREVLTDVGLPAMGGDFGGRGGRGPGRGGGG